MKIADILRHAMRALLRIKLRSLLTISGVAIGIAAMVILVSFGVQAERNMVKQFADQDSLRTITVFSRRLQDEVGHRRGQHPEPEDAGSGSAKSPALDEAALDELAKIPGVHEVYPNVFFFSWVERGDETTYCVATGLLPGVDSTELLSKLRSGGAFTGPDAREVLLTEFLASQLGLPNERSIVGQEIGIRYLKKPGPAVPDGPPGPRQPQIVEEKFVVVGVVMGGMHVRTGVSDIRGLPPNTLVLPASHARRLYLEAENPQMLGRSHDRAGGPEFMSASVIVDNPQPEEVERISGAIRARQFNTFHVYEILKVITYVFIVINVFMGALGSIALIVASLQIVNTMLMSILERTREIGVMKAIGARNRDIRRLFVAESLIIGFIGAALGVGGAWAGGKAIELGIRTWAAGQANSDAVATMSLFALPGWLVGGAFAFGMGVSLLAALYPAHRAARVDPVIALRRD